MHERHPGWNVRISCLVLWQSESLDLTHSSVGICHDARLPGPYKVIAVINGIPEKEYVKKTMIVVVSPECLGMVDGSVRADQLQCKSCSGQAVPGVLAESDESDDKEPTMNIRST